MSLEEFLAQYGEQEVLFSSYYKYTFTFTNPTGLGVWVGGSSDDIYRFEVQANSLVKVKDLPVMGATKDGICLGYWY